MNNQFFITRNSEIKLFVVLAVALIFLLIGSVIFGLKVERGDTSVPSETVFKLSPEVSLKARAAYIYDVRTKTVLFAKNEDIRLPLASLTKIMSALVAQDASPLYSTVTVSTEALQVEGDSGLRRDERWSLQNLLDFSLVTSSNDGMRAVALSLGALSKADATTEEIINDFVGQMNLKAGELNLKNTYFWNETGLDQSDVKGGPPAPDYAGGRAGAYGTARDISMLLEHILTHNLELFTATRETTTTLRSLDNYAHVATNTNSIVAEIPGLLASKTGFTDTAGGNLVIIFDPELGRPIIITVLGSTGEGRFEDMRALVGAVMEYIVKNQQPTTNN